MPQTNILCPQSPPPPPLAWTTPLLPALGTFQCSQSVGQGPAQEQHQAAEARVHHSLPQSTVVLRSTLVSGEAWEADLHMEW